MFENLFSSAGSLPVSGTLNAVGTAASAFMQTQQARSQFRALAEGFAADAAALTRRASQVRQQGVARMGARAVQAQRDLGRLQAILSSSGVRDSSGRLMAEVERLAAMDNAETLADTQAQIEQIAAETAAARMGASGRVASVPRTSALQAAGSIFGGFANTRPDTMRFRDLFN